MPDKIIYLIRHAHPDYPGGVKMCLGRKNDLPLSPVGFEQAEALRRFFSAIPLEAVYASPLLRARQTAEAMANGLRPVHILDDLIELDGGEWDGLTFDELRERYPVHFAKSGRRFLNPPGGESNESGLARIRAALDHVDTGTLRCAAIVAHGGVNRLLLCSLLGLPMDEKRKTAQDYAGVSLLALENGIWTVQELCIPIPDMR